MKRLLIQKIETIGNKRRTTTITEAGITMKETPKPKVEQAQEVDIPDFMYKWMRDKRQRKDDEDERSKRSIKKRPI